VPPCLCGEFQSDFGARLARNLAEMWILFALLSAVTTGMSAVVEKIGLKNVDATAGLAVQSVVILVLSWVYAGSTGKLTTLSRLGAKDWGFLVLAGAVTTLAYLFYFGAIKAGDVSRVAPIDRLSLVFSILFAAVFLSEKLTPPVMVGAGLMAVGALIIAAFGSGK